MSARAERQVRVRPARSWLAREGITSGETGIHPKIGSYLPTVKRLAGNWHGGEREVWRTT